MRDSIKIMTTRDDIQNEQDALQSLMELYDLAKRCHMLYEELKVVSPHVAFRPLTHIPPPDRPEAPREATDEWIWIRLSDAVVSSVILAALRSSTEPMRARDVKEFVLNALPNAASGSIPNAGTRLQEDGVIERIDDGWKLLRPESAGIIHGGFLWANPSVLMKPEIAAHRRDAILHILRHFPTGLQVVQIVEQLKQCPWVHAPVNKDLLKADMGVLAEQRKVRQRGNSGKWELIISRFR